MFQCSRKKLFFINFLTFQILRLQKAIKRRVRLCTIYDLLIVVRARERMDLSEEEELNFLFIFSCDVVICNNYYLIYTWNKQQREAMKSNR